MATAITIRVDRRQCMGTGNCVFWLPKVFGFSDEDGKSFVLDPSAAPLERVLNIRDQCPVGAISVDYSAPRATTVDH